MQNYIGPKGRLHVVAGAAHTSGDVVVEQDTIGIAQDTVASGGEYDLVIEGIFELQKDTVSAWLAGEDLYWDGTSEVTTVATGGTRIGVAERAAATLDTKGRVDLNASNTLLVPQT